jgi:hypothetical protein
LRGRSTSANKVELVPHTRLDHCAGHDRLSRNGTNQVNITGPHHPTMGGPLRAAIANRRLFAECARSPGQCIVEHNPGMVKLYRGETALEPTSRRLPNRVRACTAEGAEVTPFASNTIPSARPVLSLPKGAIPSADRTRAWDLRVVGSSPVSVPGMQKRRPFERLVR